MNSTPRLVINLCDRLPNGFIAFGVFDMTRPGAFAIRDGAFDAWFTGTIPPTLSVCMEVPHEVRLAAWRGNLYSYDLQHMAEPFVASVNRFGGSERLIEYLEARSAAQNVRRHAEALMSDIERAEFVPASRLDLLAHPLTGEVMKPEHAETDGVPFAFAGLEAVWRGVDPRQLFDFVRDRNGEPDAGEFLSANFSRPEEVVADIDGLDAAAHALRYSRDPHLFRKWVSDWNSQQDVRMRLRDERKAVGIGGDRQDAIDWCRQYLETAVELERSVEELYSNPCAR